MVNIRQVLYQRLQATKVTDSYYSHTANGNALPTFQKCFTLFMEKSGVWSKISCHWSLLFVTTIKPSCSPKNYRRAEIVFASIFSGRNIGVSQLRLIFYACTTYYTVIYIHIRKVLGFFFSKERYNRLINIKWLKGYLC